MGSQGVGKSSVVTEQQPGSSGIFMTHQEAEKMSDITLRPVPLECPGGGIRPLFSLPYRMD